MKQILLIIKDESLKERMSSLLVGCGYAVVIRDNPASGLEIFSTEQFALVVIEEAIVNDSLEIRKLIGEMEKFAPAIPKLVYLNEPSAHRAVAYLEDGIYECFAPPLTAAEFLAVVRKSLGTAESEVTSYFRSLPWWWRIPYRRLVLVGGAALLACLLLAGIIYWQLRPPPLGIKTNHYRWELPLRNATGLTYAEGDLWVADWFLQGIYRFSSFPEPLMKEVYHFTDFNPLSVASGKDFLWSVGTDGIIRKHIYDADLRVIQLITSFTAHPSCLSWDGSYLWSADSQQNKIYQHLPDESLSIIASYAYPGQKPVGLCWVGKELWSLDADSGRLYQHRIQPPYLEIVNRYILERPREGGQLAGLFGNRDGFWIIYEGSGRLDWWPRELLEKFKVE